MATVGRDGEVFAVKEGSAIITATSVNNIKATCTVTVTKKIVSVTGVSLNELTIDLDVGEKDTLTATVKPDDATNKKVTWISNNAEVVAVNEEGEIEALKEGTATITVKTDDGSKTDSCTVTVTKKIVSVTGVSLNELAIVLAVGAKDTLTATVRPDDAINKKVTWSSNNAEVVAVNEEGEIEALKEGTATIIVTTDDGSKTATCAVTVTLTGIIEVTDITLSWYSGVIIAGYKALLTATVLPANATDRTITWSSSNEAVATVNNGEVTALLAGSTYITATAGEKTAKCFVTVTGSIGKVSINNGAETPFVTGTLSELFTGEVTKIVFGEGSEINGSDIKVMMSLKNSLEHLDMTKAAIVSGGEQYYPPHHTSDNHIAFMFKAKDCSTTCKYNENK